MSFQDHVNALPNVKPDFVPEDTNYLHWLILTLNPNLKVEFSETSNISDGDDEIINASDGLEEEPVDCPGKTDLLNASELLQKFYFFSANVEAFMLIV